MKLVLPPDTPRLADVHLNWRVLAFTGGLAILTGCAFGLAPVLSALRLAAAHGARRRRPRRWSTGRDAVAFGADHRPDCLRRAAGDRRRPSRPQPVDPLAQRSGLPGRTGRHGADLADRVASAAHGALPRLLPLARTQLQAAAGVSGAALVNTLPLTGAVAKRSLDIEGFTVPAIADAAAVLAERDHARLLPGDGHPPRVGPRLHARGSRRAVRVAIVTSSPRDASGRAESRSAATCASSASRTGTPSSASSPTCARSI